MIEYNGLKLDPFQESAIQHIDEGCSVLVAAPTGAGKTVIAEYALEKALRSGRHIIYTAPIKTLSNQKFRDFQKRWGNHIGLVTGDVSINPDAPARIMTTEIFRNTIFDDPARLSQVEYVIFDEIHFIDDEERGTVWEESIIFAPAHIKIIALSATVPNINQIARWIRTVRKTSLAVLQETDRPVPLKHLLWLDNSGVANIKDLRQMDKRSGQDARQYRRGNKLALIDHLREEDRLPCLYFIFNRRECEEQAEKHARVSLLTTAEQEQIMEMFYRLCRQYDVDSEKMKTLGRLVTCGVAYHHAGMLPTLKEIVEQLFTSGLIKLLFATETFALGVNMPARSVVFDRITKFDGIRQTFMRSRDYHQMAGRAGRRGIDPVGFVYLRLPPHPVRTSIIERIISDDIEDVRSQFNLSYNCILNLYHTIKENIYQAAEKSLSNFQAYTGKKHKSSRHRPEGAHIHKYHHRLDQLRHKLGLLNRLGYINNKQLTEKGLMARQIYSYELPLTEFLMQGLVNQLSIDQINQLMVALVFESKRREWYQPFNNPILSMVQKNAQPIISRIQVEEIKAGITASVRPLDFKLAGAVYAWTNGETFNNLKKYTSTPDGDIIRTFRLSAQLIKHLIRIARHTPVRGGHTIPPKREGDAPHKSTPTLSDKLYSCFHSLYRDEVDAEKQLRQTP